MVKNKNSFFQTHLKTSFPSLSNLHISKLPRLRRHLYFINQYKLIKFKETEKVSEIRLKNINFDLLIVFYNVVLFGSISKASKHLSVSQPAISLSLKKLEKESGSLVFKPLIEKKRTVSLTPFGLILFNHVQRLFQIVEESLNFSFLKSNNKLSSTNYNSLLLLKQINKKHSYSLDYSFTFLKIFSKNIPYFSRSNFKYFEDSSNLIVFKNNLMFNKKLTKLNDGNFLYINLLFEKLPSVKGLNSQIVLSIQNLSTIEIQTPNALNIAYEMKVSNFIYWGSRI